MTIDTNTKRVSYNGDGAQTVFDVPFKYYDNDHVRAILVDANDAETVWARGSDYTLTGDGSAITGKVNATTAPASGERLVIRLFPSNTQDTDLPDADYLSDIERMTDIVVQQILTLTDDVERSLKFTEGSANSGATVPDPVDNRLLGWSGGNLTNFVITDASTTTISAFMATVLDDANAATALATLGALGTSGSGASLTGVSKPGDQTIWIPAAAMTPRATNGPAESTTELATNDIMLNTLDFDAATIEAAQFMLPMPKSWDLGTLTARFFWTAASGSGQVEWTFRVVAVSDNDALDVSTGVGLGSINAMNAANDLNVSSATSALTVTGSPADNDMLIFQFERQATSGSDTLAVDAKLIGVIVIYTTDAANDA